MWILYPGKGEGFLILNQDGHGLGDVFRVIGTLLSFWNPRGILVLRLVLAGLVLIV